MTLQLLVTDDVGSSGGRHTLNVDRLGVRLRRVYARRLSVHATLVLASHQTLEGEHSRLPRVQ